MRLAVGDVVRDRTDLTLGTVAGVTSDPGGTLVAIYVPGQRLRLSDPGDLEVVARHVRPATTRQGVIALVTVLLALCASWLGVTSAQERGAGWLLMFLAGLGGYTVVTTVYQWGLRLTGPRRYRV